jgi:RecA/RadA recombinase
MVEIATSLMAAKVDIIVVDSISALTSSAYFDKKDEMKPLENTMQMGSMARDMTNAVTMMNYANQGTLLVLVSQQRKKLGSMFVSNIPTGGEAVKYFSSTIIRLFTSESVNEAIDGVTESGADGVVGRKVSWVIEANKLGPAFMSGDYRLMFHSDPVGIDEIEELATLLQDRNLVEKSGSWYTLFDMRFQGRENLIDGIRNDPELEAKVRSVLSV